MDAYPVCPECGRELMPNGKAIDKYIKEHLMYDELHGDIRNGQKLFTKVAELALKVEELEKQLKEHKHPTRYHGTFRGG